VTVRLTSDVAFSLEQSMRRGPLVVVILGLLAACTPPSLAVQGLADQGNERVLIRNGFVVPPGRLLRVDDMSVDCVIASEVFDQQEFNKVGVEATAYLRIAYRSIPVRKPSIQKASVRHRTTWSAP
jgi:hypothetical protein